MPAIFQSIELSENRDRNYNVVFVKIENGGSIVNQNIGVENIENRV